MSILISPSDNRGWGAMMRRTRSCSRMRHRSAMRGTGLRRRLRRAVRRVVPATIRSILGLGKRRRIPRTSSRTTLVAVTSRRRRRR
ncbi:pVII [Duck adenovirus 3]|uniref:PVII n=3 Tax=Duck aviadenovirus B TaxID=1534553 RepID=A0A5F2P0C2_9ADEN|nr:PVII [Duck adenovirus 2]AYH52263.1 pVII [Duck adenovirus 3]QKW89982.1 PVII [Duck aviadenovirus B]AYH52289.1 pVII [Duck adenovirus 3]AYH52321.1 pVII [Duck adenovirus 3]